MLQGQTTVQSFQDLNRSASVAGAFRLGQQLQGMQLELHRVVPSHLPAVLEAEDTVQAHLRCQWAVSGLGTLRRNAEACVEARQEALQHAVSFRDGSRASQPKFRHQPVLKRFRRSLHATLRLGRHCEYHLDPQFVHGAAELGRRTGEPRPGRMLEDGVPVDVEGNRRAVVLHQFLHHKEIVACVFPLAEECVHHGAGGVIHRQQQRELRSRLSQPREPDPNASMRTPGAFADEAVRDSLERCEANGNFGEVFYNTSLNSSPDIAPHFAATDFERQWTLLRNSVYMMVPHDVAEPEMRELLERLGKAHSRNDRNVLPGIYELWLDSVCETARTLDSGWNDDIDRR